MEQFKFHEKRKDWLSLWEIKKLHESLDNNIMKKIRKLEMSQNIIDALKGDWLKIVKGDMLDNIHLLVWKWNRITWNSEANNIKVWDIIKIKKNWDRMDVYRDKIKIWEVVEGFYDAPLV